MASREYSFLTRWRVRGTCEKVYAVLEDTQRVATFWPSLYREVEVVHPGDAHGIGKLVRVVTRGALPYSLHWNFRVTDANRPYGFSIDADGDLIGRGKWIFLQDGDFVDICYEWKVRLNKRPLSLLSFALRPLLAANHDWVMRQGERGLRAELATARKR